LGITIVKGTPKCARSGKKHVFGGNLVFAANARIKRESARRRFVDESLQTFSPKATWNTLKAKITRLERTVPDVCGKKPTGGCDFGTKPASFGPFGKDFGTHTWIRLLVNILSCSMAGAWLLQP